VPSKKREAGKRMYLYLDPWRVEVLVREEWMT
jgi:hypothetical protein